MVKTEHGRQKHPTDDVFFFFLLIDISILESFYFVFGPAISKLMPPRPPPKRKPRNVCRIKLPNKVQYMYSGS